MTIILWLPMTAFLNAYIAWIAYDGEILTHQYYPLFTLPGYFVSDLDLTWLVRVPEIYV